MVDKIRLKKFSKRIGVILMSTPQHRTTVLERQYNDISNHKNKMIKVMGDNFDFESHINKVLCYCKANPLVTLDDVILSCERSAGKGEPFCYQSGNI